MSTALKVIDLFAGVGGLSSGFASNSDFEIIAANEIIPVMADAYRVNHPSVKVYCKDVKEFSLCDLREDFGIEKGEIDIVIGGPPCQSFSTLGNRLLEDPRGKLFQEYYRLVEELNPKVFLFENVKGLVSMQKGKLLSSIICLFSSLGYKVQFKILNAADYGVPQIRERLFIIGSKLNTIYRYPEPTHFGINGVEPTLFKDKLPHLTLADAIGDLPLIKSGQESFDYLCAPQNPFQERMRMNAPQRLMDHNSPRNNPKLVRLMENLPDGGTPNDLPDDLKPKSGFANTYCRLWWQKPCTTITRNFSTPSSSRCIHPIAPRPLTTREGARLQCFPDNYIFVGSRSDKNLQIGNAVPLFLSKALSESVLSHFGDSSGKSA